MKCANCGGEWTPPPGKSVTVCPFCQEPIAKEKKAAQSLENAADTLVYIKEQYGVDMLLGEKVYTYFADLTRNQLRDETELIKQLCVKGSLDCLKEALGKPDSERENAVKRGLSKLPKYLQNSPVVADMLFDFAAALGWNVRRQTTAPKPAQPVAQQSVPASQPTQSPPPYAVKDNRASRVSSPMSIPTYLSVTPTVGSEINFADIDWRVLTVENNKALLISEKILEKRPYNGEWKNITWEQCTFIDVTLL